MVRRMADESFDTVVVGTGFASSFFLLEYLRHLPATARVLVLEKGRKIPYEWQLENRRNTDFMDVGMRMNREWPIMWARLFNQQ